MPRPSHLSWILVAAALFACADGAAPDDNLGGSADVTGVVTVHKTGDGLPDVIVALATPTGVLASTHTDALGRFAFAGVPRGTHVVHLTGLELAGLDTRIQAIEPPAREITVAGEPIDLVFTVLTLIAPRITGVVSCGGLPVAGAHVRVAGGTTDVTLATDAQGRFVALDLAAGMYAVLMVDAPCIVNPAYQVVELKQGQAGSATFAGDGS
jgi:hypothetical protein